MNATNNFKLIKSKRIKQIITKSIVPVCDLKEMWDGLSPEEREEILNYYGGKRKFDQLACKEFSQFEIDSEKYNGTR